jgi:hypothetical protein
MLSIQLGANPSCSPPAQILRALDVAPIDALVDAATRARLLRLCGSFPVNVQTVCVECRLGAEDSRVDLAFCLMPGAELPELARAIRDRWPIQPAWLRFAEFLDAWSSYAAAWSWLVPFVCPAFDLIDDVDELPAPCLSVAVDPYFFAKRLGMPVAEAPTSAQLLALAEDCSARLTGSPLSAQTRSRLGICLRAGAEVEAKHMSWMLSRAHAPMKLDVRLHVTRLQSYLEQIGWPGDVSTLVARIRAIAHWDGYIQLNLVLHPDLIGPLEVELFAGASDASTELRFELLDRLVDAGLSSIAKAEVLREAWLRPKYADEGGRIVAKSWYVKLRFGGSEECDAKAYLGLMPRLLRP